MANLGSLSRQKDAPEDKIISKLPLLQSQVNLELMWDGSIYPMDPDAVNFGQDALPEWAQVRLSLRGDGVKRPRDEYQGLPAGS